MANIEALIRGAAQKWRVDPHILRAQLNQESGLRMGQRSSAGAMDIAQFMPATARQYGVHLGDGNPADDIFGAAHYMHDNLARTGGDYRGALSIYNSGRADAYKDPKFAGGQTSNYVKSIMGAAGTGGGPRGGGNTPMPDRTTSSVPAAGGADLRKSLLLNYLENRDNPDALLQLGAGLKQVQAGPDSSPVHAGPQAAPGAPHSGPGHSPKEIAELFWQGPGGIDVKNGQVVPQGFVDGHQDHVHVGDLDRQQLIRLGKLAQRMGLNVGENSYFTGHKETSGHAPTSLHYTDQAFDASGPTPLMRRYAHVLARRFGLG